MTNSERAPILTRGTLVPVSAVVSVFALALTFHMWLNTKFTEINDRLLEIELNTADRWTGQDMKVWTLQLNDANPNLEVPDPWKVQQARNKFGGK